MSAADRELLELAARAMEFPSLPKGQYMFDTGGGWMAPVDDGYTADQFRQGQRDAVQHFIERSGKYLTNDASREAAIEDAISAGGRELILATRRKANGDFKGDKTWQLTPYVVATVSDGKKIAGWLRQCSPGVEFDFKIFAAVEGGEASASEIGRAA